MIYYGDAVADEVIRNRSVCVKVGDRIRNIRYEEDIQKELLVFVNNVVPHGEYIIYDIQPYKPVRYSKLPL
ncbi:hypothetical protein [Bacillus cereus]|uniref:Uncharacterized protein n=1 Tax=Bacillus cereus TaxID=1396 RepID=A0ABD4LN45_BACCE|nr:hypothetical protein [Bacillus cereus]MBK1611821.1 hypothetical protein [Bacillus cereus]